MADRLSNMRTVLEAHAISVNGSRALAPNLDDAQLTLESAHAVLNLVTLAIDDGGSNEKTIRSALFAVEQLLEGGIREMIVGHRVLHRLATAH